MIISNPFGVFTLKKCLFSGTLCDSSKEHFKNCLKFYFIIRGLKNIYSLHKKEKNIKKDFKMFYIYTKITRDH